MSNTMADITSVALLRRAIPDTLPSLPGVSSLLQRVVASRGITDPIQLSSELKHLHPVGSLMGVDQATQRLYDALIAQQRILIVGDFDADGATATALAMRALTSLGFQSVNYIVPNRFEYGWLRSHS